MGGNLSYHKNQSIKAGHLIATTYEKFKAGDPEFKNGGTKMRVKQLGVLAMLATPFPAEFVYPKYYHKKVF